MGWGSLLKARRCWQGLALVTDIPQDDASQHNSTNSQTFMLECPAPRPAPSSLCSAGHKTCLWIVHWATSAVPAAKCWGKKQGMSPHPPGETGTESKTGLRRSFLSVFRHAPFAQLESRLRPVLSLQNNRGGGVAAIFTCAVWQQAEDMGELLLNQSKDSIISSDPSLLGCMLQQDFRHLFWNHLSLNVSLLCQRVEMTQQPGGSAALLGNSSRRPHSSFTFKCFTKQNSS